MKDDLEAFRAVRRGPWVTVGDDIQYRFEPGPISRLYFQCSASERDWWNNFDFPAVPYRDTPVPWLIHRGFKRVWKSGEKEILPLILGAKNLEIYGYSHGGPLASLSHETYFFHKGYYPHTTTFGSPQFLWFWNYGSVYNRFEGVRNIQVNGDIVGLLPGTLLGYRHVGVVMRMGPERIFPLPRYHTPEAYKRELSAIYCPDEVER